MPRSKRAKIVHLTQTEKKGREAKEKMIETIRDAVDSYRFAWIFSIENMRNSFLKEVREEWKGRGRFFLGKNKVMAKALGSCPEDEHQLNLHKVASLLTGNVGLFFTNDEPEAVKSYFEEFERDDYARGGTEATETVVLPGGPVMQGVDPFPPSMESQLRSLGVPSSLKKGVVLLSNDYTICKKGDTMTHDQARLLKMFYIQMATFRVALQGYWSNGELVMVQDETMKA